MFRWTCCFWHRPSSCGLPAHSSDGTRKCMPMPCVHARHTSLCFVHPHSFLPPERQHSLEVCSHLSTQQPSLAWLPAGPSYAAGKASVISIDWFGARIDSG